MSFSSLEGCETSLLFPSLSITENASLVARHIHTPKVRTVF